MKQQTKDATPSPSAQKFICDGKYFGSYGEVVDYAASINCRVSNTETIRKNTYLITLSGV